MSEFAIRVENLSKLYHIGLAQQRQDTLRDWLAEAARRFRRGGAEGVNGRDTIWALKDVSFEVPRGEVLGVIGRNGAGKSTLLKILSRITEPTRGRAVINGRVGSLLEVGTGFHPELTGRENIYLNGTILGMTRKEIRRQFEAIVEFSEVEKFLDTPVKRYSSGMYVRLAFAVAAHLNPEILLVDEVLAVGDAAFQKKCLGKMGEVALGGRTILFVSHNMQAIKQLCARSLLIEDGQISFHGPSAATVNQYLGNSLEVGMIYGEHLRTDGRDSRRGAKLSSVKYLSCAGVPGMKFGALETLRVQITFDVTNTLLEFDIAMAVIHGNGSPLFSRTFSEQVGNQTFYAGCYQVEFSFDLSYLKLDSYFLAIYLLSQGRVMDHFDNVPMPEIDDPSSDPLLEAKRWGVVKIPVSWSEVLKG